MNGRIAKKIRQVNRRNWREFYGDLLELPFKNRFRIGWYIIWHSKKKK